MNITARLCVSVGILFLVLQRGLASAEPVSVSLDGEKQRSVSLWLESSLKRVFPNSEPSSAQLELLAPRNGTVSFQACVRTSRPMPLHIDGQLEGAGDLEGRVRLVGLVPMPHFTHATASSELDGAGSLPGLVPDPLYPETKALIGANE